MPTKIVVPELGESVLEATVGHWRKKEGDRVSPGEVVVELETDKVDLEVGAEQAGVLVKIERKEGEDVRIGDVLGLIEEQASGTQPSNGSGAQTQSTLAPATSQAGIPEPGSPRHRNLLLLNQRRRNLKSRRKRGVSRRGRFPRHQRAAWRGRKAWT